MAVNRVIEIGHLTKDMDLKFTTGGMAIGNFSIAVNRKVKKDQEWVDEVNYFDVSIFGKQAQNLQRFLVKGKLLPCSIGYAVENLATIFLCRLNSSATT